LLHNCQGLKASQNTSDFPDFLVLPIGGRICRA
jgi:hypothetical protein